MIGLWVWPRGCRDTKLANFTRLFMSRGILEKFKLTETCQSFYLVSLYTAHVQDYNGSRWTSVKTDAR